jgi:hypothetical protein
MEATTPPPETAAFNELHELLAQSVRNGDTHQHERRRDQRYPFCRVQLMAPCGDDCLPSSSDFRQVQCSDLSPRGFSYLAQEPPNFKYLIVALGDVPFKFFIAEIRHILAQRKSIEEPERYLIGCRFVRRVT